MYFLCILFYRIICFIIVLIHGGLSKPSTPGSWHECSGKYYYLSSKHSDVYYAHTFCSQLLKKPTHLADLGSSPITRAEQMLVDCKLPFVNNRQYWIECQYGQRQTDCTVLVRKGGRIDIDIVSCSSDAYPVCETLSNPVTSTVAPTTLATTGLPNTLTAAPFPRRCASDTGWFAIGQHNYCISNEIYNYTDAWMACIKISGRLADLHSVKQSLHSILRGLGLGQSIYLKAWVKGNGTEGMFRIDGFGNYHFAHEPFEVKHRIFCEREMRPSATPSRSYVPLSSTDLLTASTKAHVLSTESLAETSSAGTTTLEETTVTSSVIHTSPPHANPILSLTSSVPVTQRPEPPKTPSTTTITANNSWTKIGGQEYYTNYKPESFTDAVQYCSRILNASLVAFLNPVRYFQVMAQLNLENGSYWVGGHQSSTTLSAEKCILYQKRTATLSPSGCPMKFYSVCGRSVFGNNVTEIMADPEFKSRLKELTVDKSETSVNRRKLVSVNDEKRPSAKAVGSISVFVLCITIALLLFVDLTKMCRVCFR